MDKKENKVLEDFINENGEKKETKEIISEKSGELVERIEKKLVVEDGRQLLNE